MAGLVQHDRGEPADRGEVPGGEELRHDGRVGGQEAVRAELGRGQADVGHLGQHPVGSQLVAPAGHLAHPPGDRRAGDLVGGAAHTEISL